jgi:hypothetical protein
LLGHLGQEVLARLGEPDLSWVAANQSVGAAEQVGDPALAGASAWRVCHAVLRVDDMDEVYTGRPTPRGLERALDEPTGELLSVYGGFHLVGAVASARAGGRPPNARSPVAPEAANLSLDYTKAAFKGVAASDRPRSRRVKKCDQRGGEQDNKHGDDHGPDEVHRRLLASRAIATTTRTSKTSRSIDCRAAGAACQRGR